MVKIFDFIHEYERNRRRHVVVVGDLNTEPFDMLETRFFAARSRSRATTPEHHTDRDIRRVRTYNCAWRLTGESQPSPLQKDTFSVAGTYYEPNSKQWRTFDHILVTRGLIGGDPPHLLEEEVCAVAHQSVLDETGHPRKFYWDERAPRGVSDHVPIRGSLLLPEESLILPKEEYVNGKT